MKIKWQPYNKNDDNFIILTAVHLISYSLLKLLFGYY